MVKVTTSINIDSDKRELAKKRGIVLSDILDQALDIALGIELKESTKLMENKEDLESQKEILKNEKNKFLNQNEKQIKNLEDEKDKTINKYIKNYEKQIKILEDEKEKFLKNYLKDHEDKLESLAADKEIYLKNHDSNISEIDFKLKNIDKALESAIMEDKQQDQKQDYLNLLLSIYKNGENIYKNENMGAIEDFADKYEMSQDDFYKTQKELQDDLLYINARRFGTVEFTSPTIDKLINERIDPRVKP